MQKIALLGDSITEGLGSKKINYVQSLLSYLSENDNGTKYEVRNFGVSGTMIDYCFDIQERIDEFNPNIVIIFYGNVEAIYRPNMPKDSLSYKLLPKRYKKNFSMIDPRPFYSHNFFKKMGQKIDSTYRFCIKRHFLKKFGSYRLLDLENFEKSYSKVVLEQKNKNRRVICISNVRIDDYYFPHSSKSLEEYREVIKLISERCYCEYVDLYNWQLGFEWKEIFGQDHFHPNEKGYQLIGELFAKQIIKEQK